jgi:hypothetical protein
MQNTNIKAILANESDEKSRNTKTGVKAILNRVNRFDKVNMSLRDPQG